MLLNMINLSQEI